MTLRSAREVSAQSSRKWYLKLSHQQRLVRWAKSRAKKKGHAFDLQEGDVSIPAKCPILGTSWDVSPPSLNRKNPALGYTADNIDVVSFRANTLLNDASVEELQRVLKYAKNLLKK